MFCMFSIFKNKLLYVVFILFTFKVQAVGVSPTLLNIGANNPIASLTLSNESDVPITMQLKCVTWTQSKNEELYKDTDDLIATPQIFTISPHDFQLVRIGLERPSFGNKEKAYRVFVQEVIPRHVVQKKDEIKIALRLSLPVIIEALVPIQQNIVWYDEFKNGGIRKIIAENKGNDVVFINLLQGLSQNRQPVTKSLSTFAYLLPGSKKYWLVEKTTAQDIVSIKASINSHVVFVNVI